MSLKQFRKIQMGYIILYAVIFVAVSVVLIKLNLTTGYPLLDVGLTMLVTGVLAFSIAYHFGRKKRR